MMTREQAKEILPILQTHAEGKGIQSLTSDDRWVDVGESLSKYDIEAMVTNPELFRVKPEPKYRHFKNAEECWQEMQKHQPFGWVKDKNTGIYKLMTLIGNGEYDYVVGVECGFSLERVFEYYTFADGTPFGIKEEENEE